MSFKITFDSSQFDKAIKKIQYTGPARTKKVVLRMADQVKIDAEEIAPKTPHDKGELRGEVRIFAKSPILAMIWYLMPYAARWHEAVGNIDPVTGRKINFQESGVGPKYVESKMLNLGSKYGELGAALHKKEMENA